jgi:hypothetical protein
MPWKKEWLTPQKEQVGGGFDVGQGRLEMLAQPCEGLGGRFGFAGQMGG